MELEFIKAFSDVGLGTGGLLLAIIFGSKAIDFLKDFSKAIKDISVSMQLLADNVSHERENNIQRHEGLVDKLDVISKDLRQQVNRCPAIRGLQ